MERLAHTKEKYPTAILMSSNIRAILGAILTSAILLKNNDGKLKQSHLMAEIQNVVYRILYLEALAI